MPALIDLPGPDSAGGHTAAYLLDGPEPALVDCGSAVALADLEAGLAAHGRALEDIRHLLLTHIHLDHAGAVGLLAARSPELIVWVHELGARHLVDPSRLMASAYRVFGADLDRLFGPLAPVPAGRVRAVAARGELPVAGGILAVPTPGHARHHLAFATAAGVVFAGDVAGGAPPGGRYLMPEAPPPDIDVPAWLGSLETLAALAPRRLAVSHCAILDDPLPLLADLAERIPRWQGWAAGPREAAIAAGRAEITAAVGAGQDGWYLHDALLAHTYDGFRRSLGLS